MFAVDQVLIVVKITLITRQKVWEPLRLDIFNETFSPECTAFRTASISNGLKPRKYIYNILAVTLESDLFWNDYRPH